ncbi:MAG: glycerol-3-phosphate 1-O-acyltransferase PlsY [Acidobacteria bacterium]|nr:glycerol-3-phosphate 1-O-acyltransferase PlsY [Acidobacteriota bacterium]
MAFLSVILAYFIGGIPFGYLLTRWRTGQDIRTTGSGNIGATNVLRTAGRGLGFATLALDIAKGYVAVWIAAHYSDNSPIWTSLAAAAVVLGHAFPAVLKFQGGKAVASFVGAFVFLTPLPLLATTIVFLIAVIASRHISLGSIIGAATFPLAVYLIDHPPFPIFAVALLGGAFIIWRHKGNMDRLRAGTENILRLGNKTA